MSPLLKRARNRDGGHTLLEVLVALGTFVFLGGALITFLDQGVRVWRLAESRGRIYERARSILDTVATDFRAMSTDVGPDGTSFWFRLISDRDKKGYQRVRFVRTLASEHADPIARHGGEYLARADSSYLDHHGDLMEIEKGLLLSPSGFQEIMYSAGTDPSQNTLWRAVRSPIGGVGSLFIDENVEEPDRKASSRRRTSSRRSTGRRTRRGSTRGKKSDEEDRSTPQLTRMEEIARPLASDVLYFGCRFAIPTTTTWDDAAPALRPSGGSRKSGPSPYWDSTRAVLSTSAGGNDQFSWRPVDGSIKNPYDDVFPARVEVTLVLEGNAEMRPMFLSKSISVKDSTIPLSGTVGLPEDGPFRYVLVGEEWIRYERVQGDSLILGSRGLRGARWTQPAKHELGEPVKFGTSFRRIIEIPAHHMPAQGNVSDRGRGSRRRYRR